MFHIYYSFLTLPKHLCQGCLRVLAEPAQTVLSAYPSIHDSAMLSGDVVRIRVCVIRIETPCHSTINYIIDPSQ